MITQSLVVVGSLAAAGIALKLVNVLWVAATGRPVPDDPSDPSVSTGEAVAFAAASAALVGTAKMLVTRTVMALKSGGPDSDVSEEEPA